MARANYIDQPQRGKGKRHFPAKTAKECVCFNQGEYAQYEFLSGRYHRRIKDFLHEKWPSILDKNYEQQKTIEIVGDDGSAEDIEKLRELTARLEEFLNISLYSAVKENVNFLHAGLSEQRRRSIVPPRVCVKLNGPMQNEKETIVDFIRDKSSLPSEPTILDENSGFLHIRDTGQFFYCGDIPADAKAGIYRNPRLISDKVRDFKLKGKPNRAIDLAWAECWRGGNHSPMSSYKSTLIIPSTLLNNNNLRDEHLNKNNLSDEFIESFSLQEIDRVIFAYLCADHVSAEYFTDSDVYLGYIIADLMSLYFFKRFQMLSHSNTYALVSRILEKWEQRANSSSREAT